MNPIDFPEKTITLSKPDTMTDEECSSLHIHRRDGMCISKWKGTWRERFAFFFYGHVWLSVWSGQTQPPVCVWASKEMLPKGKDE